MAQPMGSAGSREHRLDPLEEVVDAVPDCVSEEMNPSETATCGFGNACDGDLTNDGVVNAADLARLKSVFFIQDPVADLNGDGVVNAVDLGMLKRSFFRKPGPSGLACAGHVSCGEDAP